MKVIKHTDKEKVLEEIKAGVDDEVVYLSIRPSIDVVVALLEHDPNLKTILCPPSLHELTSTRVKDALKKVGISLKKGNVKVGRPRKYTKEEIQKMLDLYREGVPVTTISEKLEIPRRTIYYYLNKVEKDEL